jgi:hypothetical protein
MRKYLNLIIAVGILTIFVIFFGSKPPLAHSGCQDEICLYFPLIYVPAPPVDIINTHFGMHKGGCNLAGDVFNPGNDPVYSVSVSAEFYDSDGDLIGILSPSPALVATLPGESNPFETPYSFSYQCPSNVDVDIKITSWSLTAPFDYRPVTVISENVDSSGCFPTPGGCLPTEATFFGEIRNDQPVTLANIKLIVKPGSQSYYGVASLSKTTLRPGEVTTYSYFLYDPYGLPISSDFDAQGQGSES